MKNDNPLDAEAANTALKNLGQLSVFKGICEEANRIAEKMELVIRASGGIEAARGADMPQIAVTTSIMLGEAKKSVVVIEGLIRDFYKNEAPIFKPQAGIT